MSENNHDYSRGSNLILIALSDFPTHIQIFLLMVVLLYNIEYVDNARVHCIFLPDSVFYK